MQDGIQDAGWDVRCRVGCGIQDGIWDGGQSAGWDGMQDAGQDVGCRAGWDVGCRAGWDAGWDAGCRALKGPCTGAARSSCPLAGSAMPMPRLAQPQQQQAGSRLQELFRAGMDVWLKALSSQNEACEWMRVHQGVVHPKISATLHQSADKLHA